MTPLLIKLKQQIDHLEQQAKEVAFGDIDESYFDEQLFNHTKTTEKPTFYLDKIKQTYQALVESVSAQDLDKSNFLSETLLNQISALTRELSTHHLRIKEPTAVYESLPEKHARHLDYLRRLQEMKFALELNANVANDSSTNNMHDDAKTNRAKIAALDNRIYRCEQAIKKIELALET